MTATLRPRLGVILANLGTPDEPTPAAVRRYLREFLSDGRVIEVPKPVWFVILNLFILTFRPRRVAKAYASIWTDGSPMRQHLLDQVAGVQARLTRDLPDRDITVLPGMSYGKPSLRAALDQLRSAGCDDIVVLPLFPQYSATSSGPVFDQVARWLLTQRNQPGMQVIRDYADHPGYIRALAASVRAHWASHGRTEKLLMSFHGIPQPYADKGDPYPERCRATAEALARELGLEEGAWAFSFQSRFGLQEWVKPYTDALLTQWGKDGVSSIQVMCPAFSADCLETLEEIAEENAETFLEARHAAGHEGGRYEYIPALNAEPAHLDVLTCLVRERLQPLGNPCSGCERRCKDCVACSPQGCGETK